MPPFIVNPKSVRSFVNEAAFEAWLAKNHASATEVWIKIFKKGTGKPSINASQAIDCGLCWGWIDGIRKGLDDESFLQRYTPRKATSRWSKINVERVQVLSKAGRMTPHGQKQVDAAKADGRWEAAYPSPKGMQLPPDFLAAVGKQPRGLATLAALPRQVTYSMAYRLYHAKAESRAKLSAKLLALLAQGEPAKLPGWPRGKTATTTTASVKKSRKKASARVDAPPRRSKRSQRVL